MPPILRSPRLVLRPWRDEDLAPFAHLNSDPEVMAWFPGLLDRAASDQLAYRIRTDLAQRGYGLWAVQRRDDPSFMGFVGLKDVPDTLPFAPAIEVGWRLIRSAWGQGLATEAAQEVVRFGFEELNLNTIVSFTVPENLASIRVIRKLGMKKEGHFEHPNLPPGHPLRQHVLYRLRP